MKKKMYTIECKFDGMDTQPFRWDWSLWKRYKTEADRDKALECLQTKTKTGIPKVQYRKGK